uniref:DNA topoisomerase (ATP-hydrolyzing) n=1 Tax=Amphimedon queenslandica TaxID=400682 RepID=A0A1X7T3E5_AMPQE
MEAIDEEWSDARRLSKEETLRLIETKVLELLRAVKQGENPSMTLVNRSGSNALRDRRGVLHLGQHRTTRYLFPQRAVGRTGRLSLRNGTQSFARIWQALALVYQLVQEGKTATQREAYYCLVKHFKSQTEFNNTLQGMQALRLVAYHISGGIAGLLLWKENGGNWENCSTSSNGKRIPGSIDDTTHQFRSMGARYILSFYEDAVFTYLCGQRIWDSLPCILMTGCGYPSLSVRALLKQLQTQFDLP